MYLSELKEGRILDYQPIRDISYFIDIWLERAIGSPTLHTSNIIYWFISLLFAYKTFALLFPKQRFSKWLFLAFALHPVFPGSVCWNSARKHILSFLFINISTYHTFSFLKTSDKTSLKKATIFYFFSCLSHPINLGWIIFSAILIYLKKGHHFILRYKSIFLWQCLVALFTILINIYFYYYSGKIYNKHIHYYSNYQGYIYNLLAFGRYIWQIIVPLDFSIIYFEGSNKNLYGLILFPILIYFFGKTVKNKKILIAFGSYIFLPILMDLTGVTTIFVSDTYLLSPIFGVFILQGYILKDYFPRRKIVFILIFVLILPFYIYSSKEHSKIWKNNTTQFIKSYENEPGPYLGVRLALILAHYQKYLEAFKVLEENMIKYPQFKSIKYKREMPRYLLNSKKISVEKKLILIEKVPESSTKKTIQNILYLEAGQLKLVKEKVINDLNKNISQIDTKADDYKKACEKKQTADECSFIQKLKDKAKHSSP